MTFDRPSETSQTYPSLQYDPNPTHAQPMMENDLQHAAWTNASPLRDMPPAGLSPQAVASSPAPPPLDPSKPSHPEWGVMKEQSFHALTLKHQRDLENHFQSGTTLADFYFWQASLGGYCMADMRENFVISSEGVYQLQRRIVEGAPHPGRRKKQSNMNK